MRDEAQFNALREAIVAARDQASPDWLAIGRPVAALLDQAPQRIRDESPRRCHRGRVPPARSTRSSAPAPRHLLGSFEKKRIHPAYAAFNLIGDPDFAAANC